MSDESTDAPNGHCPNCGRPFPASRRRCWSCSPGGTRKGDGVSASIARLGLSGPVKAAAPANGHASRFTADDFRRGPVVAADAPPMPPADAEAADRVRRAIAAADRGAKLDRLADGTLSRDERAELIRDMHADRSKAECGVASESRRDPAGPPLAAAPAFATPRTPTPKAPPKPAVAAPRPEPVPSAAPDPEIAALVAVHDALATLAPPARARVLAYVREKFEA